MTLFSADDVVRFAIRIEENGEAFYREAERLAKSEGAKKLFQELAGEEAEHRKLFQGMLEKLGDYQAPEESYEGEYMSYLRGHIDGRAVFGADSKPGSLAAAADTLSALDYAIQRELDSMLYYEELKKFVPPAEHKVVDGLIAEERIHFAQLSETRKRFAR